MQLNFRIGPVTIAIVANNPPTMWPQHLYDEFKSTDHNTTADLTIEVQSQKLSEATGKKILASMDDNWRIYSIDHGIGAGYQFEILDKSFFQPRLIARFNADWSSAKVWCYEPDQRKTIFKHNWNVGEVCEPLVIWWLTHWAARKNIGILVHSASVIFETKHGQKAFVFAGHSGAGKTTLSRLCLNQKSATVLNDERIFIWKQDPNWFVSGTPWPGMLGEATQATALLKRIFFLKKGPINRTLPLGTSSPVSMLLSEMFLPLWDEASMRGSVQLAAEISSRFPVCRLEFLKHPSVVNYLNSLSTGTEGYL
ncbi:MAG: hypothetical protein AABZ06_00080 [Bdellovibrionota bacterium]